jgi:energy-coupling factor transporter ATP-binding protein EcfA2
VFPPGQSVAELVDRLRDAGWWGQIIGPHGSGKSTLLSALEQALTQAGRRVLHIELHDGQSRLPIHLGDALRVSPFDLVMVDGYEQLNRFRRYRLRAFCQNQGVGLVVTSHKSVRMPELFRTAVQVGLAQRIVANLQGRGPSVITPEEIVERFSHHQGNLREVLMDLYDLYEDRRPDDAAADPT